MQHYRMIASKDALDQALDEVKEMWRDVLRH